ncbi:HipA family kinase [Paracoccus benzoatiresistens]|uniref:HipA-like kinase domain-containing protein n=1 Tax=Paracoccus benzoatiresistens TaxID=2997341 RepID=A0ABT4J7X4_9RHOB|nr:HipA family kinase [Paracoccus sp. EF6]MCZ0963232.1 hypothetical protein [Paracoccus sp. EF6]
MNETYKGFVRFADGRRRHAIIKDLNQTQLANELLASVLGKALQLPVPDSYLGVVPTDVLPVSKVKLSDGSGHLVFVSADVATPNLTQQVTTHGDFVGLLLIEELKKWLNLGALYAFDSWIANTDRHPGNLLIDGPNNIWLIDHGHAFTGPGWEPGDLDPVAAYQNKLALWLTARLSASQKSEKVNDAGVFATRIGSVAIPDALQNSLADRLLPTDHAKALKDFLMQRVQHVPRHAKEALGVPGLTL